MANPCVLWFHCFLTIIYFFILTQTLTGKEIEIDIEPTDKVRFFDNMVA